MVFQSYAIWPHLTVFENVAFPLRVRRRPSAEVEQKVVHALEMVGLGERARHRPYELSGGEVQRVAIARAIAHRPTLILADEPTGNLDRQSAQQAMALLRDLSRAQGAAVVLATHSAEAAAFASRVLPLRDGRLLATTVAAAPAAPPRDAAITP